MGCLLRFSLPFLFPSEKLLPPPSGPQKWFRLSAPGAFTALQSLSLPPPPLPRVTLRTQLSPRM